MTTFKKIVGWLHLWLGLFSGIVVFILGVTGCILVFEEELEPLTEPWLSVERPEGKDYANPSELHRVVSAALPGKEIHSFWYHGHGRTAHANIESDSIVYIDPYRAEIVAMVDHDNFFHIVKEGHIWLWLPHEIGHAVTSTLR